MSLAKITVTGTVTKNVEKRFSQNNLAVATLVVDIYPQDETLIKVSAIGALADRVADTIKLGDSVLVDGRLQMDTVKSSDGKERKYAVINASSIEKIGAAGVQADDSAQGAVSQPKTKEPLVQFSTEELAEDLLDPDEIPF